MNNAEKLNRAFEKISPEYIKECARPPKRARVLKKSLIAAAALIVLASVIAVPLLVRRGEEPQQEHFEGYLWDPEEICTVERSDDGFSIDDAVFVGTRTQAVDVSANCDGSLAAFLDEVEPGKYMLTVCGSGKMCDFSSFGKGLYYDAVIVRARFEYGIVSIGEYAFSLQTELARVDLPATLESIGKRAFYCCVSLEEITFPASLKYVGNSAFSSAGCRKIEINSAVKFDEYALAGTRMHSIVFPEGCTFEQGVLHHCEELESVKLPSDLTVLPPSMFEQCKSLQSVTLPDSLQIIGESAFAHCRALTGLVIPASAQCPRSAFAGCNFMIISYADGRSVLDELGIDSFDQKTGKLVIGFKTNSRYSLSFFRELDFIYEVEIGDKIFSLSENIFFGCENLRKVKIGKNCRDIGQMAFNKCAHLEAIEIDPENEVYCSIDGCLVEQKTGTLVAVPAGASIPEDDRITILGTAYAYSDISEISIPENIKKIGTKAFIGSSIKRLVIPESVEEVQIIGAHSCLEEVVIRSAETNLSGGFYAAERLKHVVLPEGMTEIPTGLFSNCSALEEIVLPKSVTKIGASAFSYCTALKKIDLSNITEIGEGAFSGCVLEEVALPSLVKLDGLAFDNCASLRRVEIGKYLTQIGNIENAAFVERLRNPFAGCPLLEILFPDGNENFYVRNGCLIDKQNKLLVAAFGKFSIPDDGSVTMIASHAAEGNATVTELIIPGQIESIGTNAFAGCRVLEYTLVESPLIFAQKHLWMEACFADCTALKTVALAHGAVTIPRKCFSGCLALERIYLPSSLLSIGYKAFSSCRSLKDIYFEGDRALWESISIGKRQQYIFGAEIHYSVSDVPFPVAYITKKKI